MRLRAMTLVCCRLGIRMSEQYVNWRYRSMNADWVHEDFDEWSELTKERDAYRADAEAEWHRNPYA